MGINIDGKDVETTENGYLANIEDWSEAVAKAIADSEDIALEQEHWDLINFLRDEYTNNNGNQPNNRTILKEMGKRWGKRVDSKYLYTLFPGNPSKQAGQIAGLPESRRKGGY